MAIKIEYKDRNSNLSGRYFYTVDDCFCREMELKPNLSIELGWGIYEKTWKYKSGNIEIYNEYGLSFVLEKKEKDFWAGPTKFNGNKNKVSLQKINQIKKEKKTKFLFITCLYNCIEKRANEYLYCLKKNIDLLNDYISNIYILYDTSLDNGKTNYIKNFLRNVNKKNNKVHIVNTKERQTYRKMIDLANQVYKEEDKVIFSNADIYFDDSLSMILDYDFSKKFFALSRREKNGGIFGKIEGWTDSWIFGLPVREFFADQQIGTKTCETAFAYRAVFEGKYSAQNPCEDIKIWHCHSSGIRNDPYMGYGPNLHVQGQEL